VLVIIAPSMVAAHLDPERTRPAGRIIALRHKHRGRGRAILVGYLRRSVA